MKLKVKTVEIIAIMSFVVLYPTMSLKNPPRTGAMIAPKATKPLKIPDALSFKESFSSLTPSAWITESMISGREAMKKNKHPMLRIV